MLAGAPAVVDTGTELSLRHNPRTRRYVARRKAQGLRNMDIIRFLKRFVAREIHQILRAQPVTTASPRTA